MAKKGIFFLLALFLAAAFIVNPIGDFPLDDDFSYGKTVKNFYETGILRMHGWFSATEVFQTFVGILFSNMFGFSFTVLRFSSILFALIGAAAFYFLLKELKVGEKFALLGTFILLFNPLYFNKAFNFHSDMYYMALLSLSTLFYVLAINRNNDIRLLLLGSIFSVCAILVRQNGLFIPMAIIAYLWLNRHKRNFSVSHFLVVAVIPVVASLIYAYWFYFIHGVTESVSLMSEYDYAHIRNLILMLVPHRIFSIFIYVGLLFLPFSFSTLLRLDIYLKSLKKFDIMLFFSIVLAGISGALFMFFGYQKLLFYMPTMMHSSGLGPVYLQGLKNPVFSSVILWLLAVIAIFSASVMALRAKDAFFKLRVESPEFLVYVVGAFQLLFLMILLAVFDRYLLPLFFSVIVFFLLNRPLFFNYKHALVIAVIIALFSVVGTQDYLSWNRARYDAINDLVAQGVPAEKIDGGFEFSAWNFYEFTKEHPEVNNAKPYDPGWIKDYFPVIDSEYVISLSPLERYGVIGEYSYFSLLTFRNEKIYALKRV